MAGYILFFSNKNISRYFYFSAIFSYAMLWVLPKLAWMGNFLILIIGPIWLIGFVFGSMLAFLWLTAVDLKNKRYKILMKRAAFYFALIILSIVTWFYLADLPFSWAFD